MPALRSDVPDQPVMSVSDGLFADVIRNFGRLRHAPVSWACAVTICAVHGLLARAGGGQVADGVLETFGLSRGGFVSGGIWQVATHGLLHGSWPHALLNAAFVLLIGPRVEHMIGRKTAAGLIGAGVVGGGLAHLALGCGLLVGLSGGCMALLLMLTTLSPQSRFLPLPVSGRSLGLGMMISALALALLDPGVGVPGFAAVGRSLETVGLGSWFALGHACHFGGGLAGWLCARWILRPRISLARLQRARARREAR